MCACSVNFRYFYIPWVHVSAKRKCLASSLRAPGTCCAHTSIQISWFPCELNKVTLSSLERPRAMKGQEEHKDHFCSSERGWGLWECARFQSTGRHFPNTFPILLLQEESLTCEIKQKQATFTQHFCILVSIFTQSFFFPQLSEQGTIKSYHCWPDHPMPSWSFCAVLTVDSPFSSVQGLDGKKSDAVFSS